MMGASKRIGAAMALLAGLGSWASCGPAATSLPKADSARAARPGADLPSWCSAVEAALDGSSPGRAERGKQAPSAFGGFHCLALPNFLVTGFYGPERNPERSDFVNGCFGGDEEAAARLRMSVRPVGEIGFRYRAEHRLAAGGKLDLGFLGPWAPELSIKGASSDRVEIEVKLADAEVRVLSSVAEILAQKYADANGAQPQSALESCIAALCERDSDQGPLVYTAKVLAAVPLIHVSAAAGSDLSGKLDIARGLASFELAETGAKGASFSLRAKEKLNVAALIEPALPAFESARACRNLRATLARRELRSSLRELGLRTLGGRSLEDVPESCDKLRALVSRSGADGAFTPNEEGALLGSLEAIEGSAKQLARAKPSSELCAARVLLEGVLTGPSADNRVHDVLTEVAQPLHRRLTELANSHALPCAEPVWYRDADKDGYGDKKSAQRASKQPAGHVANSLDCYDANPDARPGQNRYFTQHRGDGSFDYDCDGSATPAEQIVSGGCKQITLLGYPTHCWADEGWQGSVPGCGQQGRWLDSCEVATLSCSLMKEKRSLQACR
jgi:hypothetical protein